MPGPLLPVNPECLKLSWRPWSIGGKHFPKFFEGSVMASIISALETLAAKGWWREWQNPAWKQFLLTGDEKQLKKLPKFSDHMSN